MESAADYFEPEPIYRERIRPSIGELITAWLPYVPLAVVAVAASWLLAGTIVGIVAGHPVRDAVTFAGDVAIGLALLTTILCALAMAVCFPLCPERIHEVDGSLRIRERRLFGTTGRTFEPGEIRGVDVITTGEEPFVRKYRNRLVDLPKGSENPLGTSVPFHLVTGGSVLIDTDEAEYHVGSRRPTEFAAAIGELVEAEGRSDRVPGRKGNGHSGGVPRPGR